MILRREIKPWHRVNVWEFCKQNNRIKTLKALNDARGFFFEIKRKDGRQEFVHSYRLVQILIFHLVSDDEILAEAVLHDVLENISFKLEEYISCQYGEGVALGVWILSRRNGEDIKYYFARIGEEVVNILIKLADRLHNLRNMTKNLGRNKFFTKERLAEQVAETWEYIVPLAVGAVKIGCQYRGVIIEIHEELLRSLADAEWLLMKTV